MKLRYKILSGIGGVLVLGIATLMAVTSYDSACPALTEASGPDTMRAVRQRCYGIPQGARFERVARPVPGKGQVLVQVRASSVNPVEWYGASGKPYLFRLAGGIGAPDSELLGADMAGVVVAVGPEVTQYKPGDEVFGLGGGAYAEYALARAEGRLAPKPANLSFEEAAGIPIAALTALQGLRNHGRLKAGQKVLINGASGGVGTYAVQIAKALGAEVTGVCSTRNVEMVRSLGADRVIDYTREDFTKLGERYDLILDNVGNHGYLALAKVTTPTGLIVSVGGSKANPWLGPIARVLISRPLAGMFIEQELPFFVSEANQADLDTLAALAREGKLRTVIDRRYPLERTAEALEYLGSQRARGKIIITIS